MYLRPKYVRGQYTTRLTGPKRRTADSNGGRAALSQGPASERRRPHAASARARVAVPALGAGLLLVPHEDAYQSVRTCPGARGWGEAWAAGAGPFRAQKWPRMWWWCAARASHGPRPATARLCQSVRTRSCLTLSSRWRKLGPPIGASFRSARDSVCAMMV